MGCCSSETRSDAPKQKKVTALNKLQNLLAPTLASHACYTDRNPSRVLQRRLAVLTFFELAAMAGTPVVPLNVSHLTAGLLFEQRWMMSSFDSNTKKVLFVGPGGALIIGISAGVVCYYATVYIKQKLRIDDSLDVFPVHGVGGILGTFLAGIFSATSIGVFSGFGFAEGITSMGEQINVQVIGIVATLVYTAVVTYILLKLVSLMTGGLRLDEEDEITGIDLTEHDESGYNL